MQTGIIGLPQVGKTTLFRILTKANVDAKGAQTAHVGVAKVPEPRLLELAKLYNPKKITYASVQYVDLPGVQKERMRESLATLRDVDAIAHVIRVFDDPSVPHSEGTIDPLRDATNLDLELILSDHEQITKRLERLEKDLKKKKDPQFELEKVVLEKCKTHLEAEKPLRELELTPEERKPIGGFLFLSQRPMLYVLNLGDDEAAELDKAVEKHKLSALQGRPNTAVVAVCGRLEAELAEMDEKEAAELLASYGLKEPGLNRMIRATYDLMGLFPFSPRANRKCAPGPFAKVLQPSRPPAKFTVTSKRVSSAPKLFVARISSPPAASPPQKKKPRSVSKGKTTSSRKVMLFFSATVDKPFSGINSSS